MIIGIDTGARDYEEAEHVAHALPDMLGLAAQRRSDLVISTHVARGVVARDAIAVTMPESWLSSGSADRELGDPSADADGLRWAERVVAALPRTAAVVATWAGAPDAFVSGPLVAQSGAWAAAAQAAARSAGRLVHYPGRDSLRGLFAVAEISRRAAIDEVRLIGGSALPSAMTFDSRNFVRPIWEGGRTVLLVQPSRGGMVAPFEIENPPRCCDAH